MDKARALTLRYTPSARADIAHILDYLGNESPQARRNVEVELRNVFDLLQHFPLSGTATTRVGLRRRVVTPYPYVVFYRAQSSALVIIGVRHTARRPRLP